MNDGLFSEEMTLPHHLWPDVFISHCLIFITAASVDR